MCDIAPFGIDCMFGDGTHTTACCVHRLNFAITRLYQHIPFIGGEIDDYHCPDFMPDYESEVQDGT